MKLPAVAPGWSVPAAAPHADIVFFDDPLLASLTERAMQANQDIALTTARLRESRSQAGIATSLTRPSVRATASYARERESRNAPRPVIVTPSGELDPDRGSSENLYQAGFDASWEIDLFNARTNTLRAARADAEATAQDVAAVRLTVAAEVARQYVFLREAQLKGKLVRDELALQNELSQLARARRLGGMETHAGEALARSQVARREATLPQVELDASTAVHRLGVLLGQDPEGLRAELGASGKLPRARPGVGLPLPSELLQRRPDILRAERQLAAATARRALAVADLYPKLTLGASVGVSSTSAADLFSAASLFSKVGPSITWPIFRQGQIIGNIGVRDAQELAAFSTYRQTILLAFEEVENSLAAMHASDKRNAALAAMVSDGELTVALAQARYQGGMTDLREVIETRIALVQSRGELLHADAVGASAAIALSKAVGGSLTKR
ncbi:MAG: efflux transporter outer membrane subunit [Bdellovibrionales bacterium]|nr:efflux transporter outer membrane subunit [Massilia sp.]